MPPSPHEFLPTNVANQYEGLRYLYFATTGAFIWDILSHLSMDYALLFRFKIALPTVIYFASRIVASGLIASNVAFQVGPISDCVGLNYVTNSFLTAHIILTSALFLLRVRAVLQSHRWLKIFFTGFWFVNAGVAFQLPWVIFGGELAPGSHLCGITGVRQFATSALIIWTVYDTFVFIAISWKLLSMSAVHTDSSLSSRWNFRLLGTGAELQRLSRTVFRGGQRYYLIIVCANIIHLNFVFSHTVPPLLRSMFTVTLCALANVTACKVFRDVKFSLEEPSAARPVDTGNSLPRFKKPASSNAVSRDDADTFQLTSLGNNRTGVHVRTQVETVQDDSKPYSY